MQTMEPTTPDLEPMLARLRARGIDPAAATTTDEIMDRETPEEAADRRRVQAENRAARWRKRLPAMYAEAALADLDPDQHAQVLANWLDTPSATLILAGAIGTGKTHAAYAVGHAAVARGLWTEAWTVVDLLDAIKPNSPDRWAENDARACDLLLLDDLGAAKATDWAVERLTAIMDARLRDNRRTVVTTNATGDQIAEAWGNRLMDRLRYRLTAVTFRGESRRQAAW